MEKIRICLAGAGHAGEVHGDVYYLSVTNSQIVAVFDTDIAKAKNLANKYNIGEKSILCFTIMQQYQQQCKTRSLV